MHFLDPVLADGDGHYDIAIVHVGINDIINDDSLTKLENFLLNLGKVATKLKNYEIKNVCLSGLVFITRVHLP